MNAHPVVLVALTACSAAPEPSPAPTTPQRTSSGCPSADRVVPTVWAKDGWRAVLVTHPDEYETATGYEILSAEQARAAGLTELPSHVWISSATSPPCRATVTRPFRSEYQYGVELEGCDHAADGRPRVSLGLVGSEDLSRCAWSVARFEKDGAIPVEVAPAVATRACEPAQCRHATLVGKATAAATAFAYDVAQVWAGEGGRDGCAKPYGDAYDVLARGRAGWAHLSLPDDATAPVLAGVFHDDVARLVVLEGWGFTDVYTVDETTPTLKRASHRAWIPGPGTRPFRDPIVSGCAN